MVRWVGAVAWVFLAFVIMVQVCPAAEPRAVVVGRVNYIDGELLRYVPAASDWVAVVKDAPFGEEDAFFSGDRGMAELLVPNGTWIRIGDSTQIQFIALDDDISEADVAAGLARFYNKSSRAAIKATSPFGYVLAEPGTIFDFYVGEESVEVIAIRGRVSFVHSGTNRKYEATAGSPSILADQNQVSSGDAGVDAEWDRWNNVRETFWAEKTRVRGLSAQYLPPALQDEAYVLEENGRWERVYYEGAERWFWRPTVVAAGWAPFTNGRWTEWSGDQTWIPGEPFGYVTHHYGNWVYAYNRWYWTPPVARVRIGLPFLDVGFYWSPGRVSWIHSGHHVGWVPLAPREVYYSHRHWGGPRNVVITNVNIANININIGRYAYARHAVVVDQDNFFRANNYRNARVTNISRTTIVNNYRAAPVINNTVINNYTTNNQRYNYTNVVVKEKPHNTVINRIRQNETVVREGRKENAAAVEQRVRVIPEGRINREARIEQPKVTERLVPATDVNKPKSDIQFREKAVVGTKRVEPQVQPGKVGGPEARPEPGQQPAGRPERGAPTRPAPEQPAKPGERPEQMKPQERREQGTQAKPVSPPPAPPPERVVPAKPAAPQQQERVAPAKPATPQPQAQPERVAPTRPAPEQPAKPGERPEQMKPQERREQGTQAKPVSPPPAPPPERVVPAKPAAPQPQERVAPAKPATPQPQAQPERVVPTRPAPEQPAKPGERPEQMKPQERREQGTQAKPVSPPPAPPPERVAPAKPAAPQQQERVAPAKPATPPPQAQPQKAVPAKPAAPQPQERVAPAKPVTPPPAQQPERAAPAKPAAPQPQERVAPARPVTPPPQAQPQHAAPAKPGSEPKGQPGVTKPGQTKPDREGKEEEEPGSREGQK